MIGPSFAQIIEEWNSSQATVPLTRQQVVSLAEFVSAQVFAASPVDWGRDEPCGWCGNPIPVCDMMRGCAGAIARAGGVPG